MNDGSAKQQIVEAIKGNSNILVTVSDSPSVDELSAAFGLTVLLNKLDKRATAIFSGAIPPAIHFLDPDKTFEGTVDSLRDFIIALDKEKADHLRYKVDGDVVKIFITPYRTTLTEKDLQFSQGDYNVELVIALGVKDQGHLDKALSAHGRILHDATVTTISVGADASTLGSVDWRDAAASSLSEMLVGLTEALKDDQPVLDEQIATAFLTGIVSATDRFSNSHTSSRVMTMAAQLMAAGANQQLIAAKLQEAHDIGPGAPSRNGENKDGTTTLTENKSAKTKKFEKKPKKENDELSIGRDDNDKPKEVSDATAVASAAAVSDALEAAEPAKNVEEELAKQLDKVVGDPLSPPVMSDIEQQLDKAAAQEEVPTAESLAAELSDAQMPGFESLDTPAVSSESPVVGEEPVAANTPLEQPDGSFGETELIESRPGSDYLTSDQPASFDTPVDNIISGNETDGGERPVDPFSVPLPPLPELHESKDFTSPMVVPDMPQTPPEVTMPQESEPSPEPVDEGALATFPPFEELAPPSPMMPPQLGDVPPLPPLPDLPPPPPPPLFDQPGGFSVPSGPVASDQLGDIFGDAQTSAPSTPETPVSAAPSSPGQFKIPGQ